MINDTDRKLPLEYPITEALRIYAKRLLVLGIVVVANLALLGFALLFFYNKVLFLTVLGTTWTIIVARFYKRKIEPLKALGLEQLEPEVREEVEQLKAEVGELLEQVEQLEAEQRKQRERLERLEWRIRTQFNGE